MSIDQAIELSGLIRNRVFSLDRSTTSGSISAPTD